MEATGAVLRRSSASACAYVGARRRAARVRAGRGGFADEGHLRYYAAAPSARRAVEAPAKHGPLGLVAGGETQGRSISEAAAFLVKMWDDDEEEMKRREQATEEQMKAAMAGSSSESSDSECDEEDAMKAIRKKAMKAKKAEMKAMKLKAKQEKKAAAMAMACCKDEDSSSESSDSEAEVVGLGRCATLAALRPPPQIPAAVAPPSKSAETTVHCGGSVIEVCLGGKCRKSGSLELLQELEKAAGAAAAVVGCKCMGKCREGPNVRLRSPSSGQMEIKNPLCVGVGVDDVGAIVSGLLGGHDLGGGLMAA